MPTVTLNPQAGSGGGNVTCDAWARRGESDIAETFGTIRSSAGTNANNTDASNYVLRITGSSTSNRYQNLTRSYFHFDTSSIPVNATIQSATFGVYVISTTDGLSGASSANSVMVLCQSTASANNAIVSADYLNVGTTDFGRSVTQTNLTTSAYNTITVNASGLTYLQSVVGSVAKLAIRYGWDFDNTVTGITWADTGQERIEGDYADNGSNKPYLSVTYTVPGNMLSFC